MYKTKLDLTARIMTGFLTVTALGLAIFHLYLLNQVNYDLALFGANLMIMTILLIVYSACYLHKPSNYRVENGQIVIERPMKNIKIDAGTIKYAYVLDNEAMRGTKKTSGVSGLFGYFGKYENSAQGKMTWYATRQSNYVMLETVNRGKIVLTPDDLGMVKVINELLRN